MSQEFIERREYREDIAEIRKRFDDLHTEILGNPGDAGRGGLAGHLYSSFDELRVLMVTKCESIEKEVRKLEQARQAEATEKRVHKSTIRDWMKTIAWSLTAVVMLITIWDKLKSLGVI